MPLPTSGSLSLNDIHLEVGGANQDLCGMNDADFRLLVNKGDGDQQSIIEYRGKSAAFENSEASFFFRVSETGEFTQWNRPNSSNLLRSSFSGRPKHMRPAIQVDDNEYLCTNWQRSHDLSSPRNVQETPTNKVYLSLMDRSSNVIWAKEYTTSGVMSVGSRNYTLQNLCFDPKMFKLGGNYYAFIKADFSPVTRQNVNNVIVEYDIGYRFVSGLCKFNSSGQFQWCRYIGISNLGFYPLPGDDTSEERAFLQSSILGESKQIWYDKSGYAYYAFVTSQSSISNADADTYYANPITVNIYVYKINMLTGAVVDTLGLTTSQGGFVGNWGNSVGVNTNGDGFPPQFARGYIVGFSAHPTDSSKLYLWSSGYVNTYYWEIDISGDSVSLSSTEKRVRFQDLNQGLTYSQAVSSDKFPLATDPVWLSDNRIYFNTCAYTSTKLFTYQSYLFQLGSTHASNYSNTLTGYNSSIYTLPPKMVAEDENGNSVLWVGLGQDLVWENIGTPAEAQDTIDGINHIRQLNSSGTATESYKGQVYGNYQFTTYQGLFVQSAALLLESPSTFSESDFFQVTTRMGCYTFNKDLSQNTGTFGSNKYRFLSNTNFTNLAGAGGDLDGYPSSHKNNVRLLLDNTSTFSIKNSAGPSTSYSTSILSTGTNFTPSATNNVGGGIID